MRGLRTIATERALLSGAVASEAALSLKDNGTGRVTRPDCFVSQIGRVACQAMRHIGARPGNDLIMDVRSKRVRRQWPWGTVWRWKGAFQFRLMHGNFIYIDRCVRPAGLRLILCLCSHFIWWPDPCLQVFCATLGNQERGGVRWKRRRS
jgi:hypothetical protein